MVLRIVRGRVLPGRQEQFAERVRSFTTAEVAGMHGLLAFMAGYRREGPSERFVLVSSWESGHAVADSLGPSPLAKPKSADVLADVALIDEVEHFDLLGPIHRGVLDGGGVIRITRATIRPGARGRLFAFMAQKGREIDASRLLLAFAVGERAEEGVAHMIGISAWASSMVVDALADPDRVGQSLFVALDDIVDHVTVEAYRSMPLGLPESLRRLGGRRILLARFPTRSDADRAAARVEAAVPTSRDAGVAVAPLAVAAVGETHVLVARVATIELGRVERLISDLGGEVLEDLPVDRPMDLGL
jgi:quinol monooxygenase YgiN